MNTNKLKENALLIGGSGFAGWHMKRLLDTSYHVIATGQDKDIRNKDKINQLVQNTSPDIVINFASITTVRETFEDPVKTYNIGFLGMLNLLTALKRNGFKGRVLNVSSSEVYGHPTDEQLPISESMPLHPMSPYAVSKIAAEALCYQWSQTEDFEVLTVRPFTHIGPGQSDRFAISRFSKQIAEIMLGLRDPVISVGNLDTTRDFTDVRDVTRAYALLLLHGKNGSIYNVCSGNEVYMLTLLEKLINYSNLSIKIEQNQLLTRSSEQQRICGNYKKLYDETGWRPEIPLMTSLSDMLSFWINELKTLNKLS